MNNITISHIIGSILTLLLFLFLGIYSGKNVKNDDDFNTGGKGLGALLVTGSMVGTMVGGNTTIGTAQLAYTNGFSGMWFVIGSSLACLFLGLFFSKAMRDSECVTIQQIIRNKYGQLAGTITSILTSAGIIINIVAQLLAANALLNTMFNLEFTICIIVGVIIMASYVMFGGVKGTGLLGIVKLILIYIGVVTAGVITLGVEEGIKSYYTILPHKEYFNIFSRGFGIDMGSFFSVFLGVLSTQAYMQSILSGKTNKDAKKGALLSALLIPPIGLFSTSIGMYMKINSPGIDPNQAFPLFIINHMPGLFAGVILATLLIAIVGTGSGMALGFGTIFTNDIYKNLLNKNSDSKTLLRVTRIAIMVSLIISAIFTFGNLKSGISKWGFMSTGLRAVVLFIPMCTALFYKGKIHGNYIIISSFMGLIAMVVGNFMHLKFDSLFLGMFISLFIIMLGAFHGKMNTVKQNV